MNGEDREVEKLTKELQKQEDIRKHLLQSHTEVKDQLMMVKRSLKENEDDYGVLSISKTQSASNHYILHYRKYLEREIPAPSRYQ